MILNSNSLKNCSIILKRINVVLPLLDGLYAYHKAPNLSWKELQYGLSKLHTNESGVSQYASEALALDPCNKQVELASLSTQEHI